MADAVQQTGIYLHRQTNKARRVGIGITPPAGAAWVLLTDDPNAGLLAVREAAGQRQASSNPAAIEWE